MSTIVVMAKESKVLRPSVEKALDSMRANPDEEVVIIHDEGVMIGFIGSLSSVGKELGSVRLRDGRRIDLVATSRLLKDACLDRLNAINWEGPKSVLPSLIEAGALQRGGWSISGAASGQVLGGRDIVGQRSLFRGSNNEFAAIASCKKALWSMDILRTQCIPGGTILELGRTREVEHRIGELTRAKPQTFSMDTAANEVIRILRNSVKTIVEGADRVGILFSGGLDSLLVAVMADDLGLQTHLYTGVFEGSTDKSCAERTARLLDLRLELAEIPASQVESAVRKVVWEIESPDPVQVCVAMPIDLAADTAVKRGECLLLSGSGADELFGGYSKYLEAYRTYGEDKVEDMIFRDVLNLRVRDLLRDGAIGESHRVQLAAPLLDIEMVRYGLTIPVSLKLQTRPEVIRKTVLRRAAEMMGVPKEITRTPKRAAQYSSKSLFATRKLAKEKGLSLVEYLDSIFSEVFGHDSLEPNWVIGGTNIKKTV